MVGKNCPCHALERDSQTIKKFHRGRVCRSKGGRRKEIITYCMSLERKKILGEKGNMALMPCDIITITLA
jgi:hypothetical protein